MSVWVHFFNSVEFLTPLKLTEGALNDRRSIHLQGYPWV